VWLNGMLNSGTPRSNVHVIFRSSMKTPLAKTSEQFGYRKQMYSPFVLFKLIRN